MSERLKVLNSDVNPIELNGFKKIGYYPRRFKFDISWDRLLALRGRM